MKMDFFTIFTGVGYVLIAIVFFLSGAIFGYNTGRIDEKQKAEDVALEKNKKEKDIAFDNYHKGFSEGFERGIGK